MTMKRRGTVRSVALHLGVGEDIHNALVVAFPNPEASQRELDSIWGCPVRYFKRNATKAGHAVTRGGGIFNHPRVAVELALHPRLHDTVGEMRKTFLHEVGHLIAVLRFGDVGGGHGSHWRRVMTWLGAPDEPKSHSLDLAAGFTKPIAKCTACGYIWKRTRAPAKRSSLARSLEHGTATHPKCGGRVVGINVVSEEVE
jgi:predicted SprT family Zn-dependent metalloprotease